MVGNTQCTLSSSCFSSHIGISIESVDVESSFRCSKGSCWYCSGEGAGGASPKQSGRDEVELVRYGRLRDDAETWGSSLMCIPKGMVVN
jgi:hypothetical protein